MNGFSQTENREDTYQVVSKAVKKRESLGMNMIQDNRNAGKFKWNYLHNPLNPIYRPGTGTYASVSVPVRTWHTASSDGMIKGQAERQWLPRTEAACHV